jgi:hypothetical protein
MESYEIIFSKISDARKKSENDLERSGEQRRVSSKQFFISSGLLFTAHRLLFGNRFPTSPQHCNENMLLALFEMTVLSDS